MCFSGKHVIIWSNTKGQKIKSLKLNLPDSESLTSCTPVLSNSACFHLLSLSSKVICLSSSDEEDMLQDLVEMG
jgi:hypothetical protein